MELSMQNENGSAQLLPSNDDVMKTGPMSDCVSVIVLADKSGESYKTVKGYHGLGGVENINFTSLFGNTDNIEKIYVVSGSLQHSEYAQSHIQEIIDQQLRTFGIIVTPTYILSHNACVDRKGNVTI